MTMPPAWRNPDPFFRNHIGKQVFNRGFGLADQRQRRHRTVRRHLLRRDRGRHATAMPVGTVAEKVRERAGQHHRFVFSSSYVVRKLNSAFFVDTPISSICDRGSLWISGNASRRRYRRPMLPKLPSLTMAKRISARKKSCAAAPRRLIDRLVADGDGKLPITSPTHLAAFLNDPADSAPSRLNRIDDPAITGFNPVTHIRQRPVHLMVDSA